MARGRQMVSELINRRQMQVLVHSIIYYVYDDNLISDHTWSKWATELAELQKQHPDISRSQKYGEAFVGFDGSSGAFLPLRDPDANSIAIRLMNYRR